MLLGLLFGSLLAPKMAENCLGIRLGPAKSRSRAFFSGSEASKSDPRGKKEGSKKEPGSGMADPKGLKASHRRPTHLGLQVQARGPKIKSLLAGHLQIISAAEIRLESFKNAFGMC